MAIAPQTSAGPHRPSTTKLVLAFAAIYLVWGSTYLAIRYAVETIPPLITAGARHLVAGAILFAFSYRRGYRPTWAEIRAAFLIGTLFFLIGHGTLHWAEQRVASGMAALLIATEPMFIAAIQSLTGKERFNLWTVAGLLGGMAGVGLLFGGETFAGNGQALGVVVVLAGSLAWSIGVCYSRVVRLPKDPVASAAMTMLCGSVLLLAASAGTGEFGSPTLLHPSARSLMGLAYLIVLGSLVAYTAYLWLLDHCSPTVVSTHTYVNPVVAMLLGWMLAGETISGRVIVASVAILGSIGLIQRGTKPRTAEDSEDAEKTEQVA